MEDLKTLSSGFGTLRDAGLRVWTVELGRWDVPGSMGPHMAPADLDLVPSSGPPGSLGESVHGFLICLS